MNTGLTGVLLWIAVAIPAIAQNQDRITVPKIWGDKASRIGLRQLLS